MFVSKIKVVAVVAACAVALSVNSCGGKNKMIADNAAPARTGFRTVSSPADELEEIKRTLEDQQIPAGIGIGESNDEMVARNISADQARAALATSIGTQVQRLSESYAQNVSGQAKTIWEEGVRQITNEHVRGARVFRTVNLFNDETGAYKVYTLIILDPAIFKAAITEAMAREEEFELRVKKDDMMAKLDANIEMYNQQYRR